jgi:hypothetical protein
MTQTSSSAHVERAPAQGTPCARANGPFIRRPAPPPTFGSPLPRVRIKRRSVWLLVSFKYRSRRDPLTRGHRQARRTRCLQPPQRIGASKGKKRAPPLLAGVLDDALGHARNGGRSISASLSGGRARSLPPRPLVGPVLLKYRTNISGPQAPLVAARPFCYVVSLPWDGTPIVVVVSAMHLFARPV